MQQQKGAGRTFRWDGSEKQLMSNFGKFFNEPSKWLEDGRRKLKKGNNLTERMLFVLLAYESFGPMSSNAFSGDPSLDPNESSDLEGWGSLEDIHNYVHVLVGGGGHMSSTTSSAFDPIFWCHHA